MKTLIRGFGGFSCAAVFSLLAVQAGAADLSGTWTTSVNNSLGSWGEITLLQSGENITGFYSNPSPTLVADYGTNSGDHFIYGALHNNTLEGVVLLRIPSVYKNTCPYSYEGYYKIKLTLSSDGKTLTGQWLGANVLTSSSCDLHYTGWVPITLSKKTSITGNPSTAAATLDSNLNMHIPGLIYQPLFGNPMNLWVDLQFAPAADSSLTWKLSNYGVNP